MPDQAHLYAHIEANAPLATRMVVKDDLAGRSVAICGAGPTLATARISQRVDEVWACNSALPYLLGKGARVTHGFCIDQGEAMLAPAEWGTTYPVEYLLASSAHPKLAQQLVRDGASITWFHSYLGIPDPEGWDAAAEGMAYEMMLYRKRFPESVQVGHGLNSVPRAICLAIARGFTKILVYGADCACRVDSPPMPLLGTPAYEAWMRQLVIYADGRCADTFGVDAVMAEAVIDRRRWHTRPDMVISARHMVELAEKYPAVRLVGDTLPNVLRRQSRAFMDRMPALTGVGQVSGFGNAAALHQEHAA